MFILLRTLDVWEVDTSFDAASFFLAVNMLCVESDLLVIGSYNPGEKALEWLRANELPMPNNPKPFSDSFEDNRREFPSGKAHAMYAERERLLELAVLSKEEHGSMDKPLFFDHVLIYRPGEPVLPLMNFHDAFNGGCLHLSGHYPGTTVQSFASSLAVTVKLVPNPEGMIISPYVDSPE